MNGRKFFQIAGALAVFFVIAASTAWASFPVNVQNQEEYKFDVPPGLETQVSFWKKIYTEYSTQHAVLHDADDLSIIYEVVVLGDSNLSNRRRNKIVNPVVYKYKRILRKLARMKNLEGLTPEEKRVADLVKNNFYQASRNIRMQLGQSDRFRDGLIRSGRYMDSIRRVFREVGVPEELTALPHVESSFQVGAYSSAGAAGVWQFTRRTGRRFMKVGYAIDERLDPILSAYAAAKLLKFNYEQVESWPLAITAYNHGINGMKRAKSKHGADIVEIINGYRSRTFGFASRNFFAEFLAALDVTREPEKYFPNLQLEKPMELAKVRVKDFVHIDTMGEFLGMSREEIARYNPALRRPVINGKKRIPRGFVFQAPADRYPNITSLYETIPDNFKHDDQMRSRWYTVQRGDTLSQIARVMRTSVRQLKDINNIGPRNRIYKGQVLELPGWGGDKGRVEKVVASKPEPKVVAAKYDTDADGTIEYRVRRYDNLTKIARHFDIPVPVLVQFNQMTDPHSLRPGQRLKIPRQEPNGTITVHYEPAKENPLKLKAPLPLKVAQVESKEIQEVVSDAVENIPAEEEAPAAVETALINAPVDIQMFNMNRPAFTPVKVIQGNDYDYPIGVIKVDFDETLSHIADWARVSVNEIRRLNNFRRRSQIGIHQTLKIPFRRVSAESFEEKRQEYHKAIQEDFFNNYRVEKVVVRNLKRGETLWEICNHIYTIPLWLLGKYNPEKDLHTLTAGEPIKIPMISEIKES